MTKSQPTPPATVLVAIDVAKLRNEVLVEVPDARRRRRMTVTNTRAEHDRLVAELHALERPVTLAWSDWPLPPSARLEDGAGRLRRAADLLCCPGPDERGIA